MYQQSTLACLFLSTILMMTVLDSSNLVFASFQQTNHLDVDLNSIFVRSQGKKQMARDIHDLHESQRSKRSYMFDFGLSRGYSGGLYGRYLVGKNAANNIYGPGRKR